MRPRREITGPVIDAPNPLAPAGFHERLLGWPMVAEEGPRPGFPPGDGWVRIRWPEGT